MPQCEKCNESFPNWVKIDGKLRNISNRKYCLSCSPFGMHNTKKISGFDRKKHKSWFENSILPWEEIQAEYNGGLSCDLVSERFNISRLVLAWGKRNGFFKTREKPDAMKNAVKEGRHKGWKTRKLFTPSFPERYFMSMLNAVGITNYIHEHKVGNYFIDFAFLDKKMALEIDGSQHLTEESVAHDQIRDERLRSEGWTIFRIPWKNIKTDSGRAFLKDMFSQFLIKYRSMQVIV